MDMQKEQDGKARQVYFKFKAKSNLPVCAKFEHFWAFVWPCAEFDDYWTTSFSFIWIFPEKENLRQDNIKMFSYVLVTKLAKHYDHFQKKEAKFDHIKLKIWSKRAGLRQIWAFLSRLYYICAKFDHSWTVGFSFIWLFLEKEYLGFHINFGNTVQP